MNVLLIHRTKCSVLLKNQFEKDYYKYRTKCSVTKELRWKGLL